MATDFHYIQVLFVMISSDRHNCYSHSFICFELIVDNLTLIIKGMKMYKIKTSRERFTVFCCLSTLFMDFDSRI